MNYGKAVEEVWSWRETLAKELEKIPENKRGEYINNKAINICQQYGVECKTEEKRHAQAA